MKKYLVLSATMIVCCIIFLALPYITQAIAVGDDITPPTGTIEINSGAAYTNTRNVTLTISASDDSGVSKMNIYNGSAYSDANWEDYATSKSWVLPETEGTKTVRIRFRDSVGNQNITYAAGASIILDTTAPELQNIAFTADGSDMVLDSGAYVLSTNREASKHYVLQFKGTTASEALGTEVYPLYLESLSGVTKDELKSYYDTRTELAELAPFKDFLKAAVDGNTGTDPKPFAYIYMDDTSVKTVKLADAAKHDLMGGVLTDMDVPGDYPLGTYTVTGKIKDLAGNEKSVTFVLHVVDGTPSPALSAEDFGVMDLSGVKGYTAGFGLSNATLEGATSVVVKLYAGDTLLQTDTATAKFATDITGTQFSSPFDVLGTFDYPADGYWTNERETEYGKNTVPTRVVATVTLAGGKVVTAENTNLTGDTTLIVPLGTLSAEDFGVVNYDTGLGILKGYTAGFGLTDATFEGVKSVVVKLYAENDQLLQTNTAVIPKFNQDIKGTQISSPFDVSGTFDYATDGYWANVRESQFGQSVAAVKVVANVALANGKELTAQNTALTGTPSGIFLSRVTDKDQCKNDGWKNLIDKSDMPFKNQGDCVSSVVSNQGGNSGGNGVGGGIGGGRRHNPNIMGGGEVLGASTVGAADTLFLQQRLLQLMMELLGVLQQYKNLLS